MHKKTVVACAITPTGRDLRTFGTLTGELLQLADWLAAHGVTDVAMESTGSFWKPIYTVLEGRFALVAANARHVKAVPSRKTDVRDAEWIAELLRRGLIRASFVPEPAERELRELVRYRASLVQERTNELNRVAKVLEGAYIRLASVASVGGASSRAILAALVAGETDTTALAELARGRLRDKREALAAALTGSIGAHQRLRAGGHAPPHRRARRADRRGERGDRSAPAAARGRSSSTSRPSRASAGAWPRSSPPRSASPWRAFPLRTAPGVLGRHVPGQRRVGREAALGSHPEGQPLAPGSPRRGGACRRADADLPRRAVPPPRGPSGCQACRGGGRAHYPCRRHHLLANTGAGYRDLGPDYDDRGDLGHVTRRLARRIEAFYYQVALSPVGA